MQQSQTQKNKFFIHFNRAQAIKYIKKAFLINGEDTDMTVENFMLASIANSLIYVGDMIKKHSDDIDLDYAHEDQKLASHLADIKFSQQSNDKLTLEDEDEDMQLGTNGKPLTKVSWSASEIVPTKQFGNVVVGPCRVDRYVEDDGDNDSLLLKVREVSEICEKAVSEDRKTLHYQLRQSTEGRVMP